ncbi:hypothetical protein [Hydrogenophaga sp.]|uniref:hypothetical protein n=1 Tax=Hydrogenophaga sp. TaxID=1904254 RepID=UPI003D0F12C4
MTQKAQPTPKSSRRRRASRKKKSHPLLFNGIGSLVAGVLLWLVSLAMGAEDSTAYAAKALLAPAWMGVVLGIGLLIAHGVSKRRAKAEAAMLLRQHSTFLEPMPRLPRQPKKQQDKVRFAAQPRSSTTGR